MTATPEPDHANNRQTAGPDANTPLTRRELRALEQAGQATTPTIDSTLRRLRARKKLRAPKKPRAFRPVRPPRGTTRPRRTAAAYRRPSAVPPIQLLSKRRVLRKLMSLGAMASVGLMMVATTIPANALYFTDVETATAAPAEEESQSIRVQPAADLTVTRDGYTATPFSQHGFLSYSSRNYMYTNDPTWSIQWPFPVAVPITDGFGFRSAPCRGCSSDHQGLDMAAGNGAPIGVIADGVVIGVNNQSWAYGQVVVVEHEINGERIESWYAHMQVGSIRVNVGDQLKVGDYIGQVGSTGASTGPHLHLEIHVDGAAVDPFQWLKTNTG